MATAESRRRYVRSEVAAGFSQSAIAKHMGVSRQRVWQLLNDGQAT